MKKVTLNAGPVWTEKEFAQYYRMSLQTIRSWRVSGKGPKFLKIGRSVRYKKEEIQKWEDSIICSSTSQNSGVCYEN
ncbi:helix-turn-helix transcriptional regulator [Terasakiella pusilla]|uniref:helix-turn-helix transcriptional regulator n=1 Tax=Terasakiella pusilla TaxID=64973 RepID=UPI003AA8CBAE